MKTKITILDRPKLKYIRKRLETTLKPVAKELGVVINVGNCTFQKRNCRFQVKVAVLDSDGKPMTEETESFNDNARLYGFEPDDMKREFVCRGKTYTLCGLNPKSRKYPIIAKGDNGKEYKFPCRVVLKALGRQVPDWLSG